MTGVSPSFRVLGILAFLTGVNEYMCQPGSTCASSRASTVAPGATDWGSSVSDHLTRSFWAKAGTIAAQSVKKSTRLNHDALQFIFNPPVYIFARKLGGHS